ncbi:aldehyde dehydrogenase family protein [Reichenbachiella sp.]|uniref:aldehyde dehydrogenase family protein n=1 Tax=Reichenbachiella sp. TaxID=2184521 RepID=UPI003BAFD8C4
MSLKFGHRKLYINGELREGSSGSTFEVVSPGNGEVCGSVAWASKEDTELALKSAQEGFELWSAMPIAERNVWIAKLRNQLIKNEDLLRDSIMFEMGKNWHVTAEDFKSITDSLEYYPEEIEKIQETEIVDRDGTHTHHMVSQPLGVAVAFLAYNFPLLNLGFKLGPALAAGCSIILKPSEFSPISAYIIGELAHQINFPKGVITVICGDTPEVGIPLCESTIPQLITMIGSTQTAQKLIEQSSKSSIKRYSMECGGNAPFIVFDDADVSAAIELGAGMKLYNSGQICVAPNRYFIHESIIDQFSEGLVAKFNEAKIGFDKDDNPDIGPMANRQSVDKIQNIINDAVAQGGQVLAGGKSIDKPGYYFEPTAIRLSNPKAAVLQEEIFGPVSLIVPFKSQEEVLGLANDTEAGLASYVFSSDENKLDYFSKHLAFGEVQLNGVKYDIYLPHGGIKNSGIGHDCSPYALDDYLVKKRVTKTL